MKARSHGGGGGNRPDLFSSFPWKTHHTCVSCLEAFFSPSESKMNRSPQPRPQENRSEADLRTKETDGTRGTHREEGGQEPPSGGRGKHSALFSGDEFPPSYSIYRSAFRRALCLSIHTRWKVLHLSSALSSFLSSADITETGMLNVRPSNCSKIISYYSENYYFSCGVADSRKICCTSTHNNRAGQMEWTTLRKFPSIMSE